MIDRAIGLAGLAFTIIFGILPMTGIKMPRWVSLAGVALGLVFLGVSGGMFYSEGQNAPQPWRTINPSQRLKLISEFRAAKKIFPVLYIFAPSDLEAEHYANQFRDAFKAAGIEVITMGGVPISQSDKGLMIGLKDENNPSKEANKFIELMHVCGFELQQTELKSDDVSIDFDLFVSTQR
jgi:hypothetical protein